MNDHQRIARQKASPSLIRLHRALSRLGSVVTVMNTGAHPDDEQNALLAWFRLGLGMRVIVACSTRGEGGQNVLGPERFGALGLLRTRELEEAAREIDADVVWLGHGPADPVHDFGFSKDGGSTFAHWGEARTVERLVRAYRQERPDVVIPTFLDVPGQHGHHCAMTRAAEAAVALAADPLAHPEHLAEGLLPWQVAKLYLPAWSGGGATYDDALPPPPATLTVTALGRDAATGAAWDHIGEWSRACHASQGMGRWRDVPRTDWRLHLRLASAAPTSDPESHIAQGLPVTLADLAALPGAPASLAAAARSIAAATDAFPDAPAILAALLRADAALAAAVPTGAFTAHAHRITRKRAEVHAAILVAAGLEITARAVPPQLAPGESGALHWRVTAQGVEVPGVTVTALLPQGITATAVAPGSITVAAAADAPVSRQFHPGWSPLGGNHDCGLRVQVAFGAQIITGIADLETPLRVGPLATIRLEPDAFILRSDQPHGPLSFRSTVDPAEETLIWDTPEGFSITGEVVQLPRTLTPGLHCLTPRIGGSPALCATTAGYPHVGDTTYLEPQQLRILALDLKLPSGRIGYIGAGGDSVGEWLARMGCDVTVIPRLDPSDDLSGYGTIVIGIVALGRRPDLIAALPALHRFVAAGGHLVSLYQRPDQGWKPESVPPRRLVIGTPSLRWRVTDPEAEVTMLLPDHPLLAGPNRIGPQDWQGWDKERGLYFAADWDAAYQPLLSMSDPGEAPLTGALVSGVIGKGRHTHVALVLHHQLDRLVPGAFRLLANLVQPTS